MSPPVLSVQSLSVTAGKTVIIDDISFEIPPGGRVGLIGESGSGKTMTGLSIMGLLPEGVRATGQIMLGDRVLTAMSEDDLTTMRGNGISMIFQEPMTALNPVMRVGHQVAEALVIHRGMSRKEARKTAIEALRAVDIPDVEAKARAYPHQLSGGQRQRVMIAMAVACGPQLVIADEPTTALDVTIQAMVLRLLRDIIDDSERALLLITHDLPVVAGMCEEVLVMHDGRIVERGNTRSVFTSPGDSYTRRLIDSVPELSRSAAVIRTARPTSPPGDRSPMVEFTGVNRTFALPRTSLRRPPGRIRAVAGATFEVRVGESFGIVGESGSGKTTLARMMVGLDPADEGEIVVGGLPVGGKGTGRMLDLRRTAQMIFQDPMGSLDPRMQVKDIIAEPLRSLGIEGDHDARVKELLDAVAMPSGSHARYAHEFSGGQRQRIAIARALAPYPRLLVADEPVSALDMTVQTITLDLINELRARYDLTLVFISHDLSVVHQVCDRIAVMKDGAIVELASSNDLYGNPQHDYTKSLLAAIPRLDGTVPEVRANT